MSDMEYVIDVDGPLYDEPMDIESSSVTSTSETDESSTFNGDFIRYITGEASWEHSNSDSSEAYWYSSSSTDLDENNFLDLDENYENQSFIKLGSILSFPDFQVNFLPERFFSDDNIDDVELSECEYDSELDKSVSIDIGSSDTDGSSSTLPRNDILDLLENSDECNMNETFIIDDCKSTEEKRCLASCEGTCDIKINVTFHPGKDCHFDQNYKSDHSMQSSPMSEKCETLDNLELLSEGTNTYLLEDQICGLPEISRLLAFIFFVVGLLVIFQLAYPNSSVTWLLLALLMLLIVKGMCRYYDWKRKKTGFYQVQFQK